MTRLAIVGSGALGQHIAHYAREDGGYRIAGFFDDFQPPGSKVGLGTILGSLDQVFDAFDQDSFDEIVVGIGYNHFDFRQEFFHRLQGLIPLATIVHTTAFVDPSASVGPGSVILPGCVLDRGVILQENVFMNVSCSLAHDTTVGAHSFLAPGVRTAGFAVIGERCFVGVGTTISNRVRLCDGSKTGAGAVVVRDTTRPEFYVGVPARCVAPSEEGSGKS